MTHSTIRAAAVAAVAALSLFGAVGCGSDSKSEATSSSSSKSSSTASSTKKSTSASSTEAAPESPGTHKTIVDYIKENGITETSIKRGDPGPSIDLPVPDGWKATDELPEAPYGAIVFTGSAVPDNPPRILALLSKLTGNVDPKQILEYAPGELENLPGWKPLNEGAASTLGGYEAFQLGGNYNVDGKQGVIAQKTVVIPADDGLYVLQLNAYADESEADALGAATDIIDEQTTITA
ncbi:LpqN/LpqT family lipoprotein [Mycolicibacterium sp. J2]|uniref:LpqN/LpqT family lipoprotein n=1 Tax=Mycolicibacterium sp. J2 TaxID=2993511 RepID=UPI00224B6D42|nr:LpqN/LpqT family lipoprotein [Mycolicibacterium sp. J2]MCX2715762.1 LpqN/LpqT family lipoprotein [Mycolicibacterium sp. J2]